MPIDSYHSRQVALCVHYFWPGEKSMQKRLDWAMGCKGHRVRIPRLDSDSTLH